MLDKRTTDVIFAARHVIVKHREMQKELHIVFIDLEKAYDRVPLQEVWRCLREQGAPENYVCQVKDTYEDARTSIGVTGKITFSVCLHQGSSLSACLFDMILDVMGRSIKEQPPPHVHAVCRRYSAVEVAEIIMLRWMCGVTELDNMRNERIRRTTKVGEITKKVQERG